MDIDQIISSIETADECEIMEVDFDPCFRALKKLSADVHALRIVLKWYQKEAIAISKSMENQDDTVLACIHVLRMDNGLRAENVLRLSEQ